MLNEKVYLAGKMTGIKYFNFDRFDYYRDNLKAFYGEVFSPADHDRDLLGKSKDWMPTEKDATDGWKAWDKSVTDRELPSLRDMLGADLQWIAKNADAIAMMPGWETSQGANAEWALAKALGLKFVYLK